LRHLCLPCGLQPDEVERVNELIYTRKRIKAGEALYQAGAPFKSLYAVRIGFFKSYVVSEDGRDQVTGFQMGGEIIGLDGIDDDRHTLNVVALEDSEVCVIPYLRLEDVCARIPALRRQIHRTMSREIVRDHGVMMLLGSMRAEERVAAFLLNLSQRFVARGCAASQFQLPMTREEIGSYLGLKLETVSRIFSRLHDAGLLRVQKRLIRILNTEGLREVLRASVR
jgi:CRP/FNR family transcriptional regulator